MGALLRRQGGHARVRIALTAADHLAKAVVCPDFNDILRQVKTALLVQLHRFAVEACAADGVGGVLLDQRILLPDETGDQRAPLFGGIILRVVLPEGLVALPAEAGNDLLDQVEEDGEGVSMGMVIFQNCWNLDAPSSG